MKTDRENREKLKLIKLLSKSPVSARKTLDDYLLLSTLGDIADYLISKGSTIPVRCGECKHYDSPFCSQNRRIYSRDGFCSYGERKEE